MNLITAMDVNATGLAAERKRVEVSAANLANSQTTRTEQGGPYRRQQVVFQTTSFKEALGQVGGDDLHGVEVSQVVDDPTPFDKRFEPGHPDADKDGYVMYPNVNPMVEMAGMMDASSSYQANISAISIIKTMINRTLEIGK